MMPLILYLAQSIICLGALMGIYYFLLRKETFFQWNRMYLIISAIIATILPLIDIPAGNPTASSTLPTQWLSTVTITSANAEKGISNSLPTSSVLMPYCFAVVSMVFVIRLIGHAIKLTILRRSGQTEQLDGVSIVYSKQVQTPFSFFSTIYLPSANEAPDHKIFLHEMAHVRYYHSIDILLLQMIQVVQWANPFYYLLAKELRNVQEFQADNHVLQEGTDLRDYQDVLLQNCFDTPKSILSNSFYFSTIKTRCTMMTQTKRKFPAVLKTVLALPLTITLLIAGIACERNPTESHNSDQASSESDTTQQATKTAETDSVYKKVPNMPEFPGGKRELQKYLGDVTYPEEAKDNNTAGKVYVKFIIDQSGKIETAEIARGTGTILDSAAIAHVRNMPQWEPGRNADGQKVKVQYVVPFQFKMDEDDK